MRALDRESYRRDGYLILKDVFADSEIAEVLAELRFIFEGQAKIHGLPPAPNASVAGLTQVMTELFRADLKSYLAAAKLCQHAVSLHRLGCEARLMSALRELGLELPVISTRPVLFIIAEALAVPGGYHKTPPHQDWRSIQGSLDGVVVWTPFGSVGDGAYALEVLPGSHLAGLLPSVEDVFGHRLAEGAAPAGAFEPLTLEKGDGVVFSTFLVHRTGEAGGPDARIAASFRYNNAAESSFAARQYPNPYIYRPDMTLLHPADTASPAKVAEVFAAKS